MAMPILDQIAPGRQPAGLFAQILRFRELCDALPRFIRRQVRREDGRFRAASTGSALR